MRQSDKDTYTTELPIKPASADTQFEATHLRLDLSYDNRRKGYYISITPAQNVTSAGLEGCEQLLIMHMRFFPCTAPSPIKTGRFNAKTLATLAFRVQQQLIERNDSLWQFIVKMISEEGFALRESYTDLSRADQIDAIVAASRKPCPDVREMFALLCDDGQYRRASGIPLGVNVVRDAEPKSDGWAYVSSDGSSTYAPRKFATEAEIRQSWSDSETRKGADFRATLEAMTDAEVLSQADYWLRYLPQKAALREETRRLIAA